MKTQNFSSFEESEGKAEVCLIGQSLRSDLAVAIQTMYRIIVRRISEIDTGDLFAIAERGGSVVTRQRRMNGGGC